MSADLHVSGEHFSTYCNSAMSTAGSSVLGKWRFPKLKSRPGLDWWRSQINDIPLKTATPCGYIDISAEHLHVFATVLRHDVPLATLGGLGCKTGAQAMSAELFGRKTGMSNVALNDQGDGAIAEAPGGLFRHPYLWPEKSDRS